MAQLEVFKTKEQKISFLKSLLSSQESPIGDWKLSKIYEARLTGGEDPYNAANLIADRQAIRDKINELQDAEEPEGEPENAK